MTRFVLTSAACAAVLVGTMTVSVAQPPGPPGGPGGPGRGGPGGPGGMMRFLPVLAALDADEDGEISSEEIDNATVALKTLDKNKDGKLTEEELRPDMSRFGEGRGRFGPPGGFPGGFGDRGRGDRGRRDRGPDTERVVDRFMAMDKDNDSKLSSDELPEQMKSLLTRADTDKDGFATREELTAMFKRDSQSGDRGPRGFGPPEGFDMVKQMMGNDKNDDGKLTKDELPEFMRDGFDYMDDNKDGAIDKEEIEKMAERFRTRGGPGGFGGGRGGFGGGRGRPDNDRPQRPPVEEE